MSHRLVVISGCSGGGKSTLVDALSSRGFMTIAEPGRRVIAEALGSRSRALPWVDQESFLRRAIEVSLADLTMAKNMVDSIFFDRGLVDAVSGLDHLTGGNLTSALGCSERYCRTVFLVPPWPEIYRTDEDRRHDLTSAVAEYERLRKVYTDLGYLLVILPCVTVEKRIDIILSALSDR